MILALTGVSLVAAQLSAQTWEHWLRTQPSSPPRFDRTPFPYPSQGKAFPYHQEAHSVNLGRFLRELRRELRPASTTDSLSGPTMSEVTELQNLLLEAAIQAEISASSTALMPDIPASELNATGTLSPASGTSFPASGTSSASSTAPLVTQPVASAPPKVAASSTASVSVPVVFPKPVFPASYSAPADNE